MFRSVHCYTKKFRNECSLGASKNATSQPNCRNISAKAANLQEFRKVIKFDSHNFRYNSGRGKKEGKSVLLVLLSPVSIEGREHF